MSLDRFEAARLADRAAREAVEALRWECEQRLDAAIASLREAQRDELRLIRAELQVLWQRTERCADAERGEP